MQHLKKIDVQIDTNRVETRLINLTTEIKKLGNILDEIETAVNNVDTGISDMNKELIAAFGELRSGIEETISEFSNSLMEHYQVEAVQEAGTRASDRVFELLLEMIKVSGSTGRKVSPPESSNPKKPLLLGPGTSAENGAISQLSANADLLIPELTEISAAWDTLRASLAASTAAEWLHNAATTAWSGICAAATAVTSAFGVAVNFLTSPIGLVILAVGALIAIIVLLIANWDTVKEVAANVWERIKAVWQTVSQWFSTNVIQPVMQFFSNLWTSITQFAVTAWTNIKNVLATIGSWINTNVIQPVSGFFASLWSSFAQAASSAWEAVKSIFGAVAGFFKQVFSDAWAGIVAIFDIAGDIFVNIKDGILNAFKVIVNALIGGLNKVVSIPFNGINSALRLIKRISILGLTPFSNLRTISVPSIPYLAHGAVLPANRPFLAMVGDQRHGTNVEAPLATIQEAVALVMNDQMNAMMAGFSAVVRAINEKNATLELDGREIWTAYNDYSHKAAVVRGGRA